MLNFTTTYASAAGNAMSSAYANGADDSTAYAAGIINGFAESISEQFFDALPGYKSAGLGDWITSGIGGKVNKYFGSTAGKFAVKALGAVGEGTEEIISNVLTSTFNDIVHAIDKNYTYGMENQTGNVLTDAWNSIFSGESGEAFVSAMISSAIVGGGTQLISNTQKIILLKVMPKTIK